MDTESTASEPSDEDLLRRLSSDPAAFEVFYRRHVDQVIGFAARRVTDPADAADLVAATFVTVLTAARSYDPGRGEPGAWLLGITARLIVNARRRKARESAALARIAGRRLLGPSDIERLEERIVVDHMKSALDANTAVVDIVDHAPDSQTGRPVIDESWSTSLSDTYRIVDLTPAGRPITGYLVTVTPHQTTSIVIGYGKRTWSKTIYPFGSATDGRRSGPQPSTPLQLRAQVKAGQVTLVGWATVDGQRAIHLTEHLSGGEINLWVNPGTYLPIREIDTAPGVSQTSDQAIRDDYQWLPATPANLRLLTPAGAIPAGFTQASDS
jgi:RNA polymerase sigma factor (sigma-70 family)